MKQIVPETARQEFRRQVAQARKFLLKLKIGEKWRDRDAGLSSRLYPDYQTYVAHQRTKLDAVPNSFMARHDQRLYAALSERIGDLGIPLKRKSVVCLAARQGTEVRRFIDYGAFAIGIDLNPGKENRYVVVGDFHDLQFADGSVDVVYTNSLDHAFDIGRIVDEVHRVLVDGGHFIAEVGLGTETAGEGARGPYESLSWNSVDEIAALITAHGFALVQRRNFVLPWAGQQLLLKRV
jgi:SAM-dependent methyltransferase